LAHVELQNAGYHDHGLGPVSILEHCELERLRSIDEESTAQVLLILHDPLSAAIPANAEQAREQ